MELRVLVTALVYWEKKATLHLCYSMSSCVIAREGEIWSAIHAYTISRRFEALQSPEWVGQECTPYLISSSSRKIIHHESACSFQRK